MSVQSLWFKSLPLKTINFSRMFELHCVIDVCAEFHTRTGLGRYQILSNIIIFSVISQYFQQYYTSNSCYSTSGHLRWKENAHWAVLAASINDEAGPAEDTSGWLAWWSSMHPIVRESIGLLFQSANSMVRKPCGSTLNSALTICILFY